MARILVLSRNPDLNLSDPEADIVLRAPQGMPADLSSPADWALADLAVLAAGQGAADEGFDAVCVADAGDFGAGALRSVLRVPVVAAGRAAMLYALTLGGRFAVVAEPDLAHRMKKQVQDTGLAAQCVGVFGPDLEGYASGADTLVLAGRIRVNDIRQIAPVADMPIVDSAPLSVSLALGFVALDLAHSARTTPAPDVPMPALISALARAGLSG